MRTPRDAAATNESVTPRKGWSRRVVVALAATLAAITGVTVVGVTAASASSVSSVGFSGSSLVAGASSNWTVSFTPATSGSSFNNRTVTVVFPSTFTVPATPTVGTFSGLGSGCTTSASATGTTVTITENPFNRTCYSQGTAQSFVVNGITNSSTPGAIAASSFSVATQDDTTAVNPSSGQTLTATAASSGQGTMTATTASVVAGSTTNILQYTFTAPAANTFASGSSITLTVPTGWTAPTTTNTTTTTGTCTPGTLATSGQVITVPQTCAYGTSFTINYGKTGSTVTAPTTAGSATFTAQSKNGTGGTLTSLTAGSPTETITAGNASKVAYTSSPPSTIVAGSTFTATAALQDTYSNTLTSDSTSTVSLTSSGGFSCTTAPTTFTSGVATYSGCSFTTASASPYAVTAASAGKASAAVGTTVTAASANKLVITSTAVSGVAGTTANIGPMTVQEQDSYGNPTTAAATVTLTSNSSGTTKFAATSGGTAITTVSIATGFSTATFYYGDTKSGSPTITAAATGLTSGSQAETITSGTASKLIVTTQPVGGVIEGTAFATQPSVSVTDANGNVVTSDASNVVLAISSYSASNGGTTQGTLACTGGLTKAAASGVATFAGCNITGTAGAGSYVLSATDGILTSTTTSAVSVITGAASKLIVTTQPVGGVIEGTAFATQPSVSVEDANGNVVTSDASNVVLAISSYSAANGGTTQGTLACTNTGGLTKAAASGVAAFAGCNITGTAGAGSYVLSATDGILTSTTTSAVSITAGTATKIVYTTSPQASVAAGATFTVVAAEQDTNSNTRTTDSTTTVSLTSSGGFSCTTSPTAFTSGVATYSGCSFTTASGTAYTVTAASGLLTSAQANTTVSASTVNKLVITSTATSGTAGSSANIGPMTVQEQDVYGNPTTTAATVTLTSNSSGTTKFAATSGGTAITTVSIATGFSTATFYYGDTKSGTPTITAAATGLISGSQAETVTASTATQLVVTTQPVGGVIEGTAFATQPSVLVEDVYGNVVTSDTSTVTLAVSSYSPANGGTTQGTLACTNIGGLAKAAVSGAATFTGCNISGTAGAGSYVLSATDGILTSTTTSALSVIAGSASKVIVTTQPVGGVIEGIAFGTQPSVSVEDANGNVVTGNASIVTLAISSYSAGNGGTTQGTLACTGGLGKAAVLGVATFTGCTVTGAAAAGSYVLSATDGILTSTTTSAVSVVTGAASKVIVTTQPVGGVIEGTAFATQPSVSVTDANGNVVTSDASNVVLAISSYSAANGGTTQGTLACTGGLGKAAVSGVATFAGCNITGTAGAGSYVLSATDGVLTSTTTSGQCALCGAASKLIVTTQPVGGVIEGIAFTTQPSVSVEDANGNVVTSDTSTVTLAVSSYTPGNGGTAQGTLACTGGLGKAAVLGVATFAGCNITGTAAAGSYVLSATDGILTSTTTSAVSVITGSASKLLVTTQPVGGVIEGTAFATQPSVSVEDANSNVVTANTSIVTLTISTYAPANGGTTRGTLACTNVGGLANAAIAGVAAFTGCNITGAAAAGTYVLSAAGSGLTSAITSSVSIIASSVSQLAVTSTAVSGAASSAAAIGPITVTEQDSFGNSTTTAETVTLSSNSTGTATFSATSGGSSITSVSIAAGSSSAQFFYGDTKSGTPTITVAASGLTSGMQTETVTSGAATKFVITSTTVSGVASATANLGPITVAEQDALGNPTTAAQTVTLSSTSNGTTKFATIAGGTAVTTVSIPAGSSSATFYYGDTKAGTPTISASGGLTSGGQTETVTPAGVAKLVLTTTPVSGAASSSATLGPITVAEQDTFNNATTTAETITLSTTSAGGVFASTSGASTTTSITISAGSSSTSFFYGDVNAGSPTITAAASGLTSGSQTENITAANADHLVFVQGPISTYAGKVMAPSVTVQVIDLYGNPATTTGLAVTLTPSAGTIASGATASTDTTGRATFDAVTINTANAGLTLTASAAGVTSSPASSAVNITVLARNGSLITDTATDIGSGVSAVAYYYCPNFTGTCTSANWVSVGSSTSGPTYPVTWTTTPDDGSYHVVAVGTDNLGNVSGPSTSNPVTVDNTAPTGSVSYTNGYLTSTSVAVSFSATDALTGVDATTGQLLRATAPLAAGTCGTFGAYAQIGTTGLASPYTDTSVATGSCYKYEYQVSDAAGNQATITSTNVAKIDTGAPTLAVSAVTGANISLTGSTVYYRATGSPVGTFTLTVIEATSGISTQTFPTITGWTKGSVASTSTTASVTYTLTSAATGNGPQSVSATSGAGTAASGLSFTLTPDTAVPTGGALTVNASGATSVGTSSQTSVTTFTIGTRTDYTDSGAGMASSTLTVQSATYNNNTCGSAGSGGPFTIATTVTGTTQPAGITVGYCYRYTLTGTDNVGNTTSIATTVQVPGAINKLAITSTAVTGTASATATLGAITVQEQDTYGNPTTNAQTVTLSSNSTGTAVFAATSGGTSITSVSIPVNSSSATFYYGDTKSGTPTITASTTGLASGTQSETITAAAASKYVITSTAVSGTATSTATLGPITVAEQDTFGNATTTAQTVTLASNSTGTKLFSATSGGSSTSTVSITAGSSSTTFYYGDTKAGSPTITASGLTTPGTQIETITAGTASKYAITSTAVSGTASATATLGPITVAEQDTFGNATTTAQTVTLASNSTGTNLFSATSGGSSTSTVSITAGSSSTTFYYGDTKAGTPTITASGALASGTQAETVTAAAVNKLVITSTALNATAVSTITLGPVTVAEQDSFGNATTTAETITLSSNSTGTIKFATTSGGTATTTVSIPAGSSSVNFYYQDTKAGSPTITAAATGLTSATQVETINAGAVNKLVITSTALSATASTTANMGPITVQEQDVNGNPTTTAETVSLTSNSAGTESFSLTSGGASITTVAIPANSSSATFYYGDPLAGTPTITAAVTGLVSGTQVETITAAAASKYVFTSAAVSGVTSSSANVGPITVAEQDTFGNATTAAQTVTLTSSSTGTKLFSATSGGSSTSTVSITAGSSSTTFYYGDTNAGTPTITASGALTSATQTETITAPVSPAGSSLVAAPSPRDGIANASDKFTFTYNTVMSPGSLRSGWTGSSASVYVNFTRISGSPTQMAICTVNTSCTGTTLYNLGSVDLGDTSRYITSGTSQYAAATLSMATVSGVSVVTLTLTTTASGWTTQTGSFPLTWTPSALATDLTGTASATTAVTTTAAQNF